MMQIKISNKLSRKERADRCKNICEDLRKDRELLYSLGLERNDFVKKCESDLIKTREQLIDLYAEILKGL